MSKILVVEDQHRNMRLVEQILTDISGQIELVKASSGAEALAAAKGDRFSLVLMDIALPDMDGIQITNVLRSYPQFHKVPFVAVTAYATSKEREDIGKVFNHYITKPIDEEVLVNIVNKYIAAK